MLEELLSDPLTQDKYGDKTLKQCKDWFTKTKISVRLGLQVGQADLPCIAIALGSAPEGESTLSDIDWDSISQADIVDPNSFRPKFGVTANEQYTIACFVHSEVEYCLFLYSIMMYSLMQVKFRYLDQRGFMVSSFQVGPLTQVEGVEMEQVYTRSLNLTGKVRHTWYDALDKSGTASEIIANMPPSAVVMTAPNKQVISQISDIATLMNKDILSGVL
jgi:hypothetical protein